MDNACLHFRRVVPETADSNQCQILIAKMIKLNLKEYGVLEEPALSSIERKNRHRR